MEYGVDCCRVRFIDGKWMDSKRPWYLDMPKLQPFLYPDGSDGWLLLGDFAFRIGNEVILIKAGFDFDGASIGRWLWTVVGHPLIVCHLIAALIHDALYASNRKTQHESDDIFLGVLEATGSTWICRKNYWAAVRSFGGYVYPKTDEERTKYEALIIVIKL